MKPPIDSSDAVENFSDLWERAIQGREVVRIARDSDEVVVLISSKDYDGLLETLHLLRSPANSSPLGPSASGSAVGGHDDGDMPVGSGVRDTPLHECGRSYDSGEGEYTYIPTLAALTG